MISSRAAGLDKVGLIGATTIFPDRVQKPFEASRRKQFIIEFRIMMNEWSCKIASSQMSSNVSRYSEALDFGRTIPLRHPPVSASSDNVGFNTSPLVSLPLSNSCTLEPLDTVSSGQMTTLAVGKSCLPHPLSTKTTDCMPLSSLRTNPHGTDKKRWQTADYRWMFTKRKGKNSACTSLSSKLEDFIMTI